MQPLALTFLQQIYHIGEESTFTIEQSEDIAAPVDPTCSVTDGLQTLQEAISESSQTAEQKVVDTPEIPAESPEREHVEGTPQVDLSTLLTGGEKIRTFSRSFF